MSDDEDSEVWNGNVYAGLALVLSNVALLPAIWEGARQRDVSTGIALLRTFVVSILYHMCQAGFFCLMRYELHRIADYLFVYDAIVWIITSMPFRSLRSAHDAQLHVLFYFLLGTPVLICILAEASFATLPLIGIGLPFVITALYAHSDGRRFLRRHHGVVWFVVAVLSFLIAGACMFFVPERFYGIGHSLWHVFSMLGTLFLLYSRPDQPDEPYLVESSSSSKRNSSSSSSAGDERQQLLNVEAQRERRPKKSRK